MSKYDSGNERRSVRLPHYDYASVGAYFVTLCTSNHRGIFGQIVEDVMCLNAWGNAVAESWQWLSVQYGYVGLDAFVVMPNHLHGIITIEDDCRGGSRTALAIKRKPLGSLIGAFKTVSTRQINALRNASGIPVWQRSYFEHVIRNEIELNKIHEYILLNPLRWALDHENPTVLDRGAKGKNEIDVILESDELRR